MNEKEINIENGANAGELCAEYKPDADIIIQNGHIVKPDSPLSDGGDAVYLIKRGEKLGEADIKYLLTARHTPPKVAERLAKCRMAVCGLGGLGSNIALALARMGVGGELLLIDYDVIIPLT